MAGKGKSTNESREAFRHMKREKITSPDNLFTNASVTAEFVYISNIDSAERIVKGEITIESRVFNFFHHFLHRLLRRNTNISTECDTTGLSREIGGMARACLSAMNSYSIIRRKASLERYGAQLSFLGTHDNTSEYEVRYILPNDNNVAVNYIYTCDITSRNVTRVKGEFILCNGMRITQTIELEPYEKIGLWSYSDDDCYQKYTRSTVYTISGNDGTLQAKISLAAIRFTNLGVKGTGRTDK